jgi:hypothetical protein
MLRSGQVLMNIRHGGRVVEEPPQQSTAAEAQAADTLVETREDITPAEEAVLGYTEAKTEATTAADATAAEQPEEILFVTQFDYLFLDLKNDPAAHLPGDPATVVAGLKALGDAMVEDSLAAGEGPLQATGNSIIPPVYTYWGQFIDHDLTANTDRNALENNITKPNLEPLDPDFVVANVKNLRQPMVNLDSVYGDGPTFDPNNPTLAGPMYDGIKLRVGQVAVEGVNGTPIPPDTATGGDTDPNRDLPRIGPLIDAGIIKAEDFHPDVQAKPNFRSLPFIADGRNDENLIIAQLHTAFLRFHNAVADWVQANEPNDEYGNARSEEQLFTRAQQLTRWHYQWLVVNDFLRTITLSGIVDKVLFAGPKHYAPRDDKPYMPLEYSVAAYRFGHTMVRAAYDHNRNFGRPAPGQLPTIDSASFELLFAFTGSAEPQPFLFGGESLPFNWIIEWDRFVDKGSLFPDHFARKIDTRLAPPLRAMRNQGNAEPDVDIKAILKRLARRNLLRGYLLSIPTGQSVADAMGVPRLTENELRLGNSIAMNDILEENGFLNNTPLWYYVLKEAEVRANGNSLGELGSRIVCEVIIGQILNDPESYLSQEDGWDPSIGATLPNGDPIVTIRDLLHFAGLIA